MDAGAPQSEEERSWEHQVFLFLVIAFGIAAGATLASPGAHANVMRPPVRGDSAIAAPQLQVSEASALTPGLVAVQIADVLLPDGSSNGVVLLIDGASRYVLPVFLPAAESEAIRQGLKPDIHSGAPDLLGRAVAALGAEVERVEVRQGAQQAVESRVVLRRGDRLMLLDARPAEALALAVFTHKPVYAPTLMLDEQGIRRETIQHLPGGLPSRLRDPEQL